MVEGIRTCPACLMRVLPLADGMCPACRKFNFNESPSNEHTVQAARAAAQRSTNALLYRAATLHWRLVGFLTAAVALTVARVYVIHNGTAFLGDPPIDKHLAAAVLAVAAIVAILAAWRTATALAQAIKLASSGRRTPGILTVLKEAMAFFEENHVGTVFVGPSMRDLARPEPERRE